MKMIPCPLQNNKWCELKFEKYCLGCELYSRATKEERRALDAKTK